jgi:hypothetical protein
MAESIELVCPIDRYLTLNVKSGPLGWFITLEKNRKVVELDTVEALWLKESLFEHKDASYYSRGRWLKLVHISSIHFSGGDTIDNGLGYIPAKKQLLIKQGTETESITIDTYNSTLMTNLPTVIRLIDAVNNV